MSRRTSTALVAVAGAAVGAALLAPAPAVAATAAQPGFTTYQVNLQTGEPSIGFDTKANAAMYGANTDVMRLTWNAAGAMTQTKVSAPTALTTLDAITIVDRSTHRTFNSQLVGACSLMSYSDDAGASWTPTTGCGVGTLLDHESVGAGPYAAPLNAIPNPIYPHAVYYCAQNGFSATCARSDDGGLTFGLGVPISNAPGNNGADPLGGSCSGLHGHIRVSADGTVYVPIKGCGGQPSVHNLTNQEYVGGHPSLSVSEDNGITYTIRMVPTGNNSDESDPSVDTTPDNTVYFGWEDGVNPDDSHDGPTSSARIALSHDHGQTWSTPVDLSTPLGLHNVQFPEVIAGDNGRAAMAFLGTSGIGDDQTNAFHGNWDLYVGITYDGGATWSVVDATRGHPVQRGCVDLQGIAPGSPRKDVCKQRNMLDFNDITMDGQGRVLVAYTQGCTPACQSDPSKPSDGTQNMVARQSAGRGLLAAYDGLLTATGSTGSGGSGVSSASSGGGSGGGGAPAGVALPNTAAPSGGAAWPVASALVAGGLVMFGRRRRRGASLSPPRPLATPATALRDR